MKVGDQVRTPRFLWVTIKEVFENEYEALKVGFDQPTYYEDSEWNVSGKVIDEYHMIFAAFKKQAV